MIALEALGGRSQSSTRLSVLQSLVDRILGFAAGFLIHNGHQKVGRYQPVLTSPHLRPQDLVEIPKVATQYAHNVWHQGTWRSLSIGHVGKGVAKRKQPVRYLDDKKIYLLVGCGA